MKILQETAHYMLAETRNTHYAGNYQILEKRENYELGATCAVYLKKSDAIEAFKKLN